MPLGIVDSIILIAVVATVTFMTRFAPFIVFGHRETPKSIIYLGKVLPPAIIATLVVYCLKDIDFSAAPFGACEIISVIIVALLHWWKKNTLLSVGGGTVIYMILIRLF